MMVIGGLVFLAGIYSRLQHPPPKHREPTPPPFLEKDDDR